jgi:competence ComEA-like helix-hairpin-helix protein
MHPAMREAASRFAARVTASRFAKPVARAAVVAAGLFLLAFIGSTAVAGAMGAPAPTPTAPPGASLAAVVAPALAVPAVVVPAAGAPAVTPSGIVASGAAALPADLPPPPAGHGQATADDPVILNTATMDDLRRLPRVGEKRAAAIVALRMRLGGRFRVVEDLLKVKGIGRTTFRRLRPLVRLDPPTAPGADAGPAEAPR